MRTTQEILNIGLATIAAVGLSVTITAAAIPAPVVAVSDPGGPVAAESIAEALDTPCLTEDSENCYWRADLFGNRLGRSFVNIEGHIFPLGDILAGLKTGRAPMHKAPIHEAGA